MRGQFKTSGDQSPQMDGSAGRHAGEVYLSCSLLPTVLAPRPMLTCLCGWPGPCSAARRLSTWTSCGSPVVPLLAQPDSTVKLSIKAWTGCEALTGDSAHRPLGSGPMGRSAGMSFQRVDGGEALPARPEGLQDSTVSRTPETLNSRSHHLKSQPLTFFFCIILMCVWFLNCL